MKTEINDSTIANPERESVGCPTLFPKPQFCYKYDECSAIVKKEEYEDDGTIELAQNVSNSEIASDIKVKLEVSDGNDSLDYCSDKKSIEQDNANEDSIETSITVQAITGEKNHKCEICNKCFTIKTNLAAHLKTHTGERNHKCEICSKRFTTKRNMLQHVTIHSGELNHRCKICDKRFTTKTNLTVHVKKHTGEKPHKCALCNKRFVTKYNMLQHMNAHTGELNFKCETCDRRCTTKSNLAVHLKRHAGERNYTCEICTKSFVVKQELTKHVKTHAGERNFECTTCDKRFTTKSNLTMHGKTHTGEKNFKCDACGKCFTSKQSLSQHLKAHDGERNHDCEICKKCFTTKKYLTVHMKSHSGERNIRCEICKKCFMTRQNLGKHVKIHKCKIQDEMEGRLLGCLKTHVDERNSKGEAVLESLRNFPCVVPTIAIGEADEIDKTLVKEESGAFLMKDTFETDTDTTKRKPPTARNENCVGCIKEDEPKSTDVVNLWQTLHNEVIIKEEQTTDTSFLNL